MRIAIPTLAMLVLAIGAIPLATTDFAARTQAAPMEGSAGSSRSRAATDAAATRRPGATSMAALGATSPTATGRLAAPADPNPRVPMPRQLPPSLELVSLPRVPGTPAPPARRISRAEAVAAVMGSREFQDTVSPLSRLYLATFGRYPDYEGINFYAGQREEARPLASIADEFAGSGEFELRYGELTDAEFVARIMANVLGHESQADVRGYWTAELASGRMTRGQVIVDLAESGMFRERTAAQVFVSNAYIEILGRTPDPGGYARWVAHLAAGNSPRSVIDGLLASR